MRQKASGDLDIRLGNEGGDNQVKVLVGHGRYFRVECSIRKKRKRAAWDENYILNCLAPSI
jgi:hypothetical protein